MAHLAWEERDCLCAPRAFVCSFCTVARLNFCHSSPPLGVMGEAEYDYGTPWIFLVIFKPLE